MKGKERLIVTIIVLFLFGFMSVGYAAYGAHTSISGQATFYKNGLVSIQSATLSDYKNLENPENPEVEGKRISFDLNFNVPRTPEGLADDYYATYTITINNDTVFDYHFEPSSFVPTLTTSNEDAQVSYSIDGISNGEAIPSKTSKTFTLTINMVPNNAGNFNVNGESEIDLEEETETGTLIGSMPSGITGNLTNVNNRVQVNVSVINSYDENKTFNITLSNNKFYLVDQNNNPISTYTINANGENTYPVYIKVRSDARFASTRQTVNVYFEPSGGTRTSMGTVSLTVTKDEDLVDITPPTISNVVGTQQTTKREINVSYNASDNIGVTNCKIEVIKVVDNTEETISTINTNSDVDNYTVSVEEDGHYYFKVTAYDAGGLNATTSSTEKEYRWTMNVNITVNNGTPNGNYTVDYGQNYTATLRGNNGYNTPESVTVNMVGGTADYTYNNGSLNVRNVTGDLTITATAPQACLVEGTKIRLANNKVKNVEDIKYDDLLLVWNYDTGKLTKEYPIWIEKEKVGESYTKITFTDNSSINIKANHSFFSPDYNKFIDMKDIKVGTSITKLVNNKLKVVKVKEIKTINKKVKYYFVASTRYYNIIANDFVTTDAFTEITNLYPFNSNIMWEDKKVQEIDYSYMKDILPYYMYKGFRAGELAILLNKNKLSMEEFKGYVSKLIINNSMLKEPITKNNTRYWMVTTSNDKITSTNKQKYLIEEGTYYKLPTGKKIKWYSTSEHKYYSPGTKVKVWTGMHFEKIKK